MLPGYSKARRGQHKKTIILGLQLVDPGHGVSEAESGDDTRSVGQCRCRELYTDEMYVLLHRGEQVVCGPDTPDNFATMSIDGLISEFKTHSPTLFELFNMLGDSRRNVQHDGEVEIEALKVITSLCTLMNARSQRSKGLQLLLMLISRATSKQVR